MLQSRISYLVKIQIQEGIEKLLSEVLKKAFLIFYT